MAKINQSTILLCSKNYAQIISKNPKAILLEDSCYNFWSSSIV